MAITTREARQLSTASEWTLVESSLPSRVRELSPARLRSRIERARKLRDKYVDLARRQHRRTRSKRSGQPNERLNARTKRKAVLFSEVLVRYQAAARATKAGTVAKGARAGARARRSPTGGGGKVAKGKGARIAKRRAAKAHARGARTAAKGAEKRQSGARAARTTRAASVRTAAAEPDERITIQALDLAAVAANAAAAQEAATSVAPPEKVKKTRAPFVPKSDVHMRTGQHRIHAHVSSRGRRRQGRRDSR